MWRFLHTASEWATNRDTRRGVWTALFVAMQSGLPCPECRDHYNAWVTTVPLGGGDLRPALQTWIRALHNAVNARRGVAEWTVEQVVAVYGEGAGAEGRFARAREALAAAAAAGVASWVIRAGEEVIRAGMS
jgi:hypothetical protein